MEEERKLYGIAKEELFFKKMVLLPNRYCSPVFLSPRCIPSARHAAKKGPCSREFIFSCSLFKREMKSVPFRLCLCLCKKMIFHLLHFMKVHLNDKTPIFSLMQLQQIQHIIPWEDFFGRDTMRIGRFFSLSPTKSPPPKKKKVIPKRDYLGA